MAADKKGLETQHRRQVAADQDREHDRVADLTARVELLESVEHGPANNRRIEQGPAFQGGGHYLFLTSPSFAGARRLARALKPARTSRRRRAPRCTPTRSRKAACAWAGCRHWVACIFCERAI